MAPAAKDQKLTAELHGIKDGTSKGQSTVRVGRQNQKLDIEFRRTVRVADNGGQSKLAPSMGKFPVYSVEEHKRNLSPQQVKKGGFFIPMYQREAMWISFASRNVFSIRVYVGGVNAVSGETTKTLRTRAVRLQTQGNIQDYIITPDQLWLDGIAAKDGFVHQFVAMPLGSGYSVEAQITGQEFVGGMQFEVIPAKTNHDPGTKSYIRPSVLAAAGPSIDFAVKTLTGKVIFFKTALSVHIATIKSRIYVLEGVPSDQQRLVYNGYQLEDEKTVGEIRIKAGATLHLILKLRGGGSGEAMRQMRIAAGGLIKQTVRPDKNDAKIWDVENQTMFHLHLMNPQDCSRALGFPAPTTPITQKTYAEEGFPYFDIYDEKPSGVTGNFDRVTSVNTLDKRSSPTAEKRRAIEEVDYNPGNSIVMLGENGSKRAKFRPVSDSAEEARNMHG